MVSKAAGQKEKKDLKRSIKEKKKFKGRNSIGKAKKKAGRYVTRTQAVAKLQVPLKDFRKLCILKGVYPREPKKKFKGANTTYFFAKDILFLAHEPLLAAFREQKVWPRLYIHVASSHLHLHLHLTSHLLVARPSASRHPLFSSRALGSALDRRSSKRCGVRAAAMSGCKLNA